MPFISKRYFSTHMLKHVQIFDSLEGAILDAIDWLEFEIDICKLGGPKPLAEIIIEEKEKDGKFQRNIFVQLIKPSQKPNTLEQRVSATDRFVISEATTVETKNLDYDFVTSKNFRIVKSEDSN